MDAICKPTHVDAACSSAGTLPRTLPFIASDVGQKKAATQFAGNDLAHASGLHIHHTGRRDGERIP